MYDSATTRAWLADVHVGSHSCPDPFFCTLPASYSPPSNQPGETATDSELSTFSPQEHAESRDAESLATEYQLAKCQQPRRRVNCTRNHKHQGKSMDSHRETGQHSTERAQQIRRSPRKKDARTMVPAGPTKTVSEPAQLTRVQPTQSMRTRQAADEDIEELPDLGSLDIQATLRAPSRRERGGGNDIAVQEQQRQHIQQLSSTGSILSKQLSSGFPTRTTSPTRLSHPTASKTPSMPSSSVRTRSTSPIKRVDDLLRLRKQVHWITASLGELRSKMAALDDPAALSLFDNIKRIAILGRGYLPLELKAILEPELGLGPDGDLSFAPRVPRPFHEDEISEARILLDSIICQPSSDSAGLEKALHHLSLGSELQTLRKIVASSTAFKKVARAEAAWNECIHSPLLNLAVLDIEDVEVENVTRANIARRFVPTTTEQLDLSLGGKMIDFAMVLSCPETYTLTRQELPLTERMVMFLDSLEPSTFNQTTYRPLCLSPTGVFIETKIDGQRYTEGQAQLGMWLASWYTRVSELSQKSGLGLNLPAFLPVLLVVAESWELWFALDKGSEFQVFGPLYIGRTSELESIYRLLAVLRLLADWVGTEFKDWVERFIS